MIAYPNIDPIAFSLGPLDVHWYGLAYVAGFLLGWRYAIWIVKHTPRPITKTQIESFLSWAVIGVLVGGRLGYMLIYAWPEFSDNPVSFFYVTQGGMSFHGAVIGMILAMLGFSWRQKISPWMLSDLVTAVVPIGLFFGRIANFINGELYGRPSTLPWAMVFPTADAQPRHPSQLYEALLEGLVLFILLHIILRLRLSFNRPGLVAGCFLFFYGISRFLVEFVRQPDAQMGLFLWDWTAGQWLCIPMILAGFLMIVWLAVKPVAPPPSPSVSLQVKQSKDSQQKQSKPAQTKPEIDQKAQK